MTLKNLVNLFLSVFFIISQECKRPNLTFLARLVGALGLKKTLNLGFGNDLHEKKIPSSIVFRVFLRIVILFVVLHFKEGGGWF